MSSAKMTSSAVTPSVLQVIVCVVRASAPAVLALDHIVQLLDEFLDVSVLSSLPKAAASGSVRWFDRVYQRKLDASALATSPRIDEDPFIEYTLAKAMEAAVEHSHMAIVQRIHELHPRRLSVHLLPIAATTGDLALFQWLLAHRNDDLCALNCDPSDSPRPIELASCCLHHAYNEGIKHGMFHIVKWLLENGCRPCDSDIKPGDEAASRGDLEMVQWLHTNNIPHSFSKRAIDNASKNGHFQVVQYLVTNRSEGFTSEAVHNAVIGGYGDIHDVLRLSGMLPVAEFESLGKWAHYAGKAGRLDLLKLTRYTMDARVAGHVMSFALLHGHLQVVQWLCQHHQVQPDPATAAQYGHLHILQWMHHHEMFGCTGWSVAAMDGAAQNGHLAAVQWLHENRKEGCTTRAMNCAAMNGHFDVVQWLHENRQEGCTTNAMDYAAMEGHLEIVQWLHSHRTEGCTVRAMDFAGEHNHQEIVEWLHVHRTEGCTTQAMSQAAQYGHLDMIIWLHEHRQEGYSPTELIYVPLSVLKWFHFNRHEGWTTDVMDCAASCGDMATLQFLHHHRTEGCSSGAAKSAASHGHLPIVQWLHDKYPRQFDGSNVTSHAHACGHHHIVHWQQDQQLVPINE